MTASCKKNPEERIAVWVITPNGLHHAGKLIRALPYSRLFVSSTVANAWPVSQIIDAYYACDSLKSCKGATSFYSVFERLSIAIEENFRKFDAHICIFSTGIAVRLTGNLLKSKLSDPAVVVMDDCANHAISLVSGHIGGANELTVKVSQITGASPVITTATDVNGLPSIDMIARKLGLIIENPEMIKRINMAFLQKKRVRVVDPLNLLTSHIPNVFLTEISNSENSVGKNSIINGHNHDNHDLTVFCSDMDIEIVSSVNDSDVSLDFSSSANGLGIDSENSLSVNGLNIDIENTISLKRKDVVSRETIILRPRSLVAGMGCNRNTSTEELMSFLLDSFKQNNLSVQSLAAIATTVVKQDENGLLELGRILDKPIMFFSKDELNSVGTIQNPSEMVEKHLGVKSVCEAAAILAADNGKLILPKIKKGNATLAVARKKAGFL
ncbi:CbiG [Desulfamplus magnetovallimortis]|uniref:CbiG n=1 Tax=Desulfamplus magnetovallimortis TaxID=1246637 RepID=A0A1W1HCL3_9BACT|nr:cobalamin biosynthesis protein [Desulfamplus magnetovallimortis]SLM30251.1 CbiG [Desulfamplus magnetovallimortis]